MNTPSPARLTPLREGPAWWEPDKTEMEVELLRALTIAWHDLGVSPGSISASVTHAYLGEVLAWSVQHWQWLREAVRQDAAFVPRYDLNDPYDQGQIAEHERLSRTAPLIAENNDELDMREAEAELRAWLQGE